MNHLVVVNVDAVQLLLMRTWRASKLLRLLDFIEDADKLDEAAEMLRNEIETNRRHNSMQRYLTLMIGVVVLLVVLGVSAPSLAQELQATTTPAAAVTPTAGASVPEVTAPETLTIPAWLVVVIGLVACVVLIGAFLLLWRALTALEKSNPPETVREIRTGIGETIEKSFAAFSRLAQNTATPLDDLIAEIGEPGFRRLVAWLKAMPNEQITNSGPLPPEIGMRRDTPPGTTEQ